MNCIVCYRQRGRDAEGRCIDGCPYFKTGLREREEEEAAKADESCFDRLLDCFFGDEP